MAKKEAPHLNSRRQGMILQNIAIPLTDPSVTLPSKLIAKRILKIAFSRLGLKPISA
jgi:hypothetical protein